MFLNQINACLDHLVYAIPRLNWMYVLRTQGSHEQQKAIEKYVEGGQAKLSSKFS